MNKTIRTAAVIAGAAVVAVGVAAPASAINNIKGFGVQETLKDFYNLGDYSSEIGFTVKTLVPSRDAVPYPVAGRLWESDITIDSLRGTVNPDIPNFRARTADGDDYRVLAPVSIGGGPIGPGGSVSGKLYFDVVGVNPNSVIYNKNFEDLLGWVNPPRNPGPNYDPGAPGGDTTGSAGGAPAPSTGGNDVNGSTGIVATPPPVSNGVQNGPYGPSGSLPPVGNN